MLRGWTLPLALVLVTMPLAGCLSTDDNATEPQSIDDVTDTIGAILPDVITGLEPLSALDMEGSGTGIWIDEDRDLLLSANGGGGLAIANISDPAAPQLLGTVDSIYARDVDLLNLDGRPLAVLAGGGDGLHVVDTSDPLEPKLLATSAEYSVHNVAAVPGTPYVYDSSGFAPAKLIPVADLTDPENPTWTTIEIPPVVGTQPIQSDGCHDITVRMDLGMAYCAGGGSFYVAGGGETIIMDISEDPLAPKFVGAIDNPSIMYHHQALASEDGSLLMINDEFIAPNCQAVDMPAGPVNRVGQTTAAMWIYDISNPATPMLMSYVQANEESAAANCGSHFGDLIDGRDVVSWGWYQGGTMLIDISDPSNPVVLDRELPDGSVWDARYYKGHVYGSASNLQVFDIV